MILKEYIRIGACKALPIFLSSCDTIASSGIMYYAASVFMEEAGYIGGTNSFFSAAIASSTAISLVLTRPPALWKLFNPPQQAVEQELDEIDTSNPASDSTDETLQVTLSDPRVSNYKKLLFKLPIALSYSAIFTVGGTLILVQSFGSANTLKFFIADNDELVNALSYLAGIGSAASYFAFVFKAGALKNIKLLLKQLLGLMPEGREVFSRNKSHIAMTFTLSFLGAIANSTFDYFSTSAALDAFSFSNHFPHNVKNGIAGTSAGLLFYIVFLSYTLDTHKIFSGSYQKLFSEIKNSSSIRKLVVTFGSMIFLFNKAAILYIFYNSTAGVLQNEINLSETFSRVFAAFPALSATLIQAIFEFKPTLISLLFKPPPLSCESMHTKIRDIVRYRSISFFRPTAQDNSVTDEDYTPNNTGSLLVNF